MVNRRQVVPAVAVACGLVLAVVGIVNLHPPRVVAAARPAPVRIISPDVFPSPSPVPSPSGSPAVHVVMPEIGIDLPVVAGDGVNVPLYKAATFPGLSMPGEGGRSFLYAHAQRGMFAPLLVRGATGEHVDLTRADGSTLHYVVTEFYPRWPVNDLRWLQPEHDHEELVLETCTTYNSNDPRVIAVARPV